MKKPGTLEQCFEKMECGMNVGYYAFKMKMWYEEVIYELERDLEAQSEEMTSTEYELFANLISYLKIKKGWVQIKCLNGLLMRGKKIRVSLLDGILDSGQGSFYYLQISLGGR